MVNQIEPAGTTRTPEATRQPRWVGPFLEAYARMGNVRVACQVAGISKSQVYEHRKFDKTFADAWKLAESDAGDYIEQVVWERATQGVTRRTPVFHRGRKVGEKVEVTYSDRLALALLARFKPEHYGTANVRVSGEIVHTINEAEVRERLAQRLALVKAEEAG